MSGQFMGVLLLIGSFGVWLGGSIIRSRREGARREAFLQYCERMHYDLGEWDFEDDEGYTLEADGWQLEVRRKRPQYGDWRSETIFLCSRADENRPLFALQCTAGNTAFEDLPEAVRTMAFAALQSILGESADELENMRTAFVEQGRACIVMEEAEQSAQSAIERLRPALVGWRGKAPVYIESMPEFVRVRFPDCYLKTPEQIAGAVRIGLAALNGQAL